MSAINIFSHQNDFVIDKLLDYRREGTPLCLFVGRAANQSLPVETGNIWVSADIEEKDVWTKDPISKERLYIVMDFNKQDEVKRLSRLFSKVVVDQSTIKFFTTDFAKRFSVMLHVPESEMIFEADTGIHVIDPKQKEYHFDTNSYSFSIPLADMLSNTDRQVIDKIWHAHVQNHLSKLFNCVKLYENDTFPYPNHRYSRKDKDSFFIVKNAK